MASSQTKLRTLSIILGGGRGTRLYPLTKVRAKPAVPFGGKYRLIDVPISNCLNSGLNKIYVLTQFESASLHGHVQGAYQFDRFSGGFVEILAAQQTQERADWYQGTADAVKRNLIHFGNQWDEVLILSGDQLYRMDYQALINFHRQSGAEVTVCALPVSAEQTSSLGILQVDQSNRIVAFKEKPGPEGAAGLETERSVFERFQINAPGRPYLASMGIYLFERRVLYDELRDNSYVDFGKHFLPACIGKHRIFAYPYEGYWEDIGTVGSFHEASLLMAKNPAPFPVNNSAGLIYTRPRTLPTTTASRLQMTDSIVTDGCRIADAVVDQSIIGVRSIIGKNVRLFRSIMMGADFFEYENEQAENRRLGRPDVGIGDNVIIENAIIDKNVRIGSDVIIKNPESVTPADSPIYTVLDGIICIHKDAVIPSGTRIGM